VTQEISAAVVVIPACNEEILLPGCLDAVRAAAGATEVPVRVVVVLDRCTDRTADICYRFGVESVSVDARCVGIARAAGVSTALAESSSPETTWLANTDADTLVSENWLRTQIALAEDGADAVLGLVGLDADAPPNLRAAHDIRYARRRRRNGTHTHVHGANLGVRASAYLACRGFPPLTAHEDRQLILRLEAIGGWTIVRSDQVTVTTSARTESRCGAGFGTDLAGLGG
jgi:cellulose synthase/poly-beta-1,6-N-acetylglucosamine synthase-like glycosyltransferase